jgi:hypothetical protein
MLPAAPTLAVPMLIVPFDTVTVAPTSPLPTSVVALPPVKASAPGASVSIVTASAVQIALMLPEVSTAWATILRTPSASGAATMLQVPVTVAVPLPIADVPSNSVTALPASAVPVKVGVVTLVRLSVLDTPLSDATSRFGRAGVAIVVSMTSASAAEATLTLPAVSVALVVIL